MRSRATTTYFKQYLRCSRVVAVLWALFTICYAAINVLIFLEPTWLISKSDELDSFGLFQVCKSRATVTNAVEQRCVGSFTDWNGIISTPFKISMVFVGISAIVLLLCVACFFLFCLVSSKNVFGICATLQFISFLCMAIACCVYPLGWAAPEIKTACPSAASYRLSSLCRIHWPYILAIVGIFDTLFLSVLGFVLASQNLKTSKYTDGQFANSHSCFDYGLMGNHHRADASVYPGDLSQFSTLPISANNRISGNIERQSHRYL